MKIKQGPVWNLSDLNSPYKHQAIEGRFYHCKRVFIVHTDKGYFAVAFNLFERITAVFAKIVGKNNFKDKLGAKHITILSSADIKKVPPAIKAPILAPAPESPSTPSSLQPKISPGQNLAHERAIPPAAVPPALPVVPAKAPVQNPEQQPVNTHIAAVQAIQPMQAKIHTIPVSYCLINEVANYQPDADLAKLNALARLFNVDMNFQNIPIGQKADIGLCVCATPHRTLNMIISQLKDNAKNLVIIALTNGAEISNVPREQISLLKSHLASVFPDWTNPENRRSAIQAIAKLLPLEWIKAIQRTAPKVTYKREVRCGMISEASKYIDNEAFVKKLNKIASLFNYEFIFKFEAAPQSAPNIKNIYDVLIMGPNFDKYAYWKYTADHFMVMDSTSDIYQKYCAIDQAKMSPFAPTLNWAKEWDNPAEFREALRMVLRLIPDQHLPAV